MAFVELQDNAIRDISALAAKTEIYHLDLNRNNISVLGNTFDDYQNNANVFLDGNTLLCSEVSNIGNSSANIQWNGDCGEDEDGDGVIDLDDAFPLDKAASVDSDVDGLPDEWNPGFGQSDSSTGLVLDNDDDNDGILDADDAFPNDAGESLDSDGDGVGDNSDAYPDDSARQSLELAKALSAITDEGLFTCISNQASGLTYADELRALGCGEQIDTLDGLENFPRLQELRFSNHNFTDLQPLSALTKLTKLDINWGQAVLSDIEPLKNLKKLKFIELRG